MRRDLTNAIPDWPLLAQSGRSIRAVFGPAKPNGRSWGRVEQDSRRSPKAIPEHLEQLSPLT
jgi:hypothetical protein